MICHKIAHIFIEVRAVNVNIRYVILQHPIRFLQIGWRWSVYFIFTKFPCLRLRQVLHLSPTNWVITLSSWAVIISECDHSYPGSVTGRECQCQSEKIRGAPSLVNPDYCRACIILVWALFTWTGLMSSRSSVHRALVKRPECLPGFSNQVSGMRLSKRVKIRLLNFLCILFLFRSHICTSCHDWAILSLAHDSWYSKRESYHQIPVTT